MKPTKGRRFGRWTDDLSVGALDPVLDAHARFDANVEGGRPCATEPQWPRIKPSWAAF